MRSLYFKVKQKKEGGSRDYWASSAVNCLGIGKQTVVIAGFHASTQPTRSAIALFWTLIKMLKIAAWV